MNLENLIRDKGKEILRVSRHHGARRVRIFGSAARGQADETSDLDILVEMETGSSLLDIIAIKQDIEDLLGCKVDVVTESALSPYIRESVIKEARTL
jgi:predicted nucleotidyltransferase